MREHDSSVPKINMLRPRPNQPYRCGYLALGVVCEEGPTRDGVCCQRATPKRMRAELNPTETADGRAVACGDDECERACLGASACQLAKLRKVLEKPSHRELGPCIPTKASWFTRQTVALNCAILVGGLLLLCMALPQREQVFVPGGLSQKHSQILGNKLVADRCSLCHPNAHSREMLGMTQDDLCMKCHDSHMPAASRGSAHDLSARQILRISHPSRAKNASGADALTKCAMCHVEHHGATSDIQEIADARCQACHAEQFASFADGHPQFDRYPYQTPRSLAFDHTAHMNEHFGKKGETFDCSRCHVDTRQAGSVGSVFRSVGFEQACASCHAETIRSSTINGWVLLQLPCIEPGDREHAPAGLSDWPDEATFDYDGEVSVAMRLLLSVDPQARAALEHLPPSGKLAEIPELQRTEAVRSIALAFRRLVREVADGGQEAWQSRLIGVFQTATGAKPGDYEHRLIQEMSAGLPPDLFRVIERDWFQQRSSEAPVVSNAGSSFQFASGLLQQDDLLDGLDDDALLLGDGVATKLEGPLLEGPLLDSDLLDSDLDSSSSSVETRASDGHDDALPKFVTKNWTGPVHMAQGGWYLDSQLMAVRFMPRGHADKFLSAWAEFESLLKPQRLAVSDRDSASGLLLTAHGRLQAGDDDKSLQVVPGGCTECHLLETTSPVESSWARWRSTQRPETARLFTKFDHTPHLTLATLSDCKYCHVLESTVVFETPSDMPTEMTALSHVSAPSTGSKIQEFVPMDRNQCAACHRKGGANDGCTQCHNYHVSAEGFDWSRPRDRPAK